MVCYLSGCKKICKKTVKESDVLGGSRASSPVSLTVVGGRQWLQVKGEESRYISSQRVLDLFEKYQGIEGMRLSRVIWSPELAKKIEQYPSLIALSLERIEAFSLSFFQESRSLEQLELTGIGGESSRAIALHRRNGELELELRSCEEHKGEDVELLQFLKFFPDVKKVHFRRGVWSGVYEEVLEKAVGIHSVVLTGVEEVDLQFLRWRKGAKSVLLRHVLSDPGLEIELHLENGCLGLEIRGREGDPRITWLAVMLVTLFPDAKVLLVQGGKWDGSLIEAINRSPGLRTLALHNVSGLKASALEGLKGVFSVLLTGSTFQRDLMGLQQLQRKGKLFLEYRFVDWEEELKEKRSHLSFPSASFDDCKKGIEDSYLEHNNMLAAYQVMMKGSLVSGSGKGWASKIGPGGIVTTLITNGALALGVVTPTGVVGIGLAGVTLSKLPQLYRYWEDLNAKPWSGRWWALVGESFFGDGETAARALSRLGIGEIWRRYAADPKALLKEHPYSVAFCAIAVGLGGFWVYRRCWRKKD